jgi:hypothetical protein
LSCSIFPTELLTPEQRKGYQISPNEDAAQFLITKLAPHQMAGPIAALQIKVNMLFFFHVKETLLALSSDSEFAG